MQLQEKIVTNWLLEEAAVVKITPASTIMSAPPGAEQISKSIYPYSGAAPSCDNSQFQEGG